MDLPKKDEIEYQNNKLVLLMCQFFFGIKENERMVLNHLITKAFSQEL